MLSLALMLTLSCPAQCVRLLNLYRLRSGVCCECNSLCLLLYQKIETKCFVCRSNRRVSSAFSSAQVLWRCDVRLQVPQRPGIIRVLQKWQLFHRLELHQEILVPSLIWNAPSWKHCASAAKKKKAELGELSRTCSSQTLLWEKHRTAEQTRILQTQDGPLWTQMVWSISFKAARFKSRAFARWAPLGWLKDGCCAKKWFQGVRQWAESFM